MAITTGKKFGGREKGAANKVTTDARELFVSIMEGETQHIKQVLADIRATDPVNYLRCLTNLYPYFIPKKTDVTTNGKDINNGEGVPFHKWADDNDNTESEV